MAEQENRFQLLNVTLPSVTDQLEEVNADTAAVLAMVSRLLGVLAERGLLTPEEMKTIWGFGQP